MKQWNNRTIEEFKKGKDFWWTFFPSQTLTKVCPNIIEGKYRFTHRNFGN